MRHVFLALALLTTCVIAKADVVTQPVDYEQGGTTLIGYLAYDDATAARRPGVLVVHEWWGLNDYAKDRARALARMGYVAFAIDMYGNGHATTDAAEAAKLAGQFRANWTEGGRTHMRERAQAALVVLTKHPLVDPRHIAVIGYCFGGTTALELGYSGADIAAVVTFHGGLTVPDSADLPGIKARFLILHGADDPSVKPETIAALQAGLKQAHADWEMVTYGGAVHGFSNPSNTAAYNAKAARRSWETMKAFLDEVLKGK